LSQGREERLRARRERQQARMRAIFGKPIIAWIALAFFAAGNLMMLMRSVAGVGPSGPDLTVITLPATALSQAGVLLWVSLFPSRAPFRVGIAAVALIGLPGFWLAAGAFRSQTTFASSGYLWVMGAVTVAVCLIAVAYRLPGVRAAYKLLPLAA